MRVASKAISRPRQKQKQQRTNTTRLKRMSITLCGRAAISKFGIAEHRFRRTWVREAHAEHVFGERYTAVTEHHEADQRYIYMYIYIHIYIYIYTYMSAQVRATQHHCEEPNTAGMGAGKQILRQRRSATGQFRGAHLRWDRASRSGAPLSRA